MITASIIDIEEEAGTKNIIIWVAFADETGSEIPFYRGGVLLAKSGHNVWPLYAIYENFIGRSQEERVSWVRINVEHQIGNIIREQAKVINPSLVQTLKADLEKLVVTKDSVEVELYSGGVVDQKATLKSDGSYTVASMTEAA